MTEQEIEALLAEAISAYRQIPTNLKVDTAIEALTGFAVIPLDLTSDDANLLSQICSAAELLVERSAVNPIETGRLNELGNNIEEPLLKACKDVGLEATWPKRVDGTGGRSGYPDIAIDIDGQQPTYLEAKVIGAGSEGSTFRSFYLSPSENPKVCVNARHLLVAFVHKRQANSSTGRERYSLISYKIVDLARVRGKIKFEYQSNNKNMYLKDAVVASG